jgi:hypothetical protein
VPTGWAAFELTNNSKLREQLRLDPNSSPPLFDPEQDFPRRAVAPLSRQEVGWNQRLLVNPILPILTAILAVWLIYHSLRTRNVFLFVAALGLLVCALPLFQFHCLDCGAVGWYASSGRHACPAVVDRCGRAAPMRAGVRPKTQFLFWVYALWAGLVGYAVVLLMRL